MVGGAVGRAVSRAAKAGRKRGWGVGRGQTGRARGPEEELAFHSGGQTRPWARRWPGLAFGAPCMTCPQEVAGCCVHLLWVALSSVHQGETCPRADHSGNSLWRRLWAETDGFHPLSQPWREHPTAPPTRHGPRPGSHCPDSHPNLLFLFLHLKSRDCILPVHAEHTPDEKGPERGPASGPGQ